MTMNSVFIDSPVSDDERRLLLCEGRLFVYSQRRSVAEFAECARQMVEKSFPPLDRPL